MTQPILGNVYATFIENALGLGAPLASGEVAIIGVASTGTTEITTFSKDQIALVPTTFGVGPLADRILDAFLGGASVVRAVRLSTSETGTLHDVDTSLKTGDGAIAFTGTPTAEIDLVIEVLTGGAEGTATFRYSLDGGDTWSDEITTAASVLLGTSGITVTFTDDATPANSFDAGERVSVHGAAPVPTTAEMNTAIDVLLAGPYRPPLVLIAGTTGDAQHTALVAKYASFAALHWNTHLIAEARGQNNNESVATFVTAMLAAKTTANKDLSIVIGRGEIVALDGVQRASNVAGIYLGWLSALPKLVDSPGKPLLGQLPGLLTVAPATKFSDVWRKDISDAQIADLEDAGYVTVRQYEGMSGVYFTRGRLSTGVASDFQTIDQLRPLLTAATLCRVALLPYLQSEADEAGLEFLLAIAQRPLDAMVADGQAYALEASIAEDQDIDLTKEVVIDIRMKHVAKAEWINTRFGLSLAV